MVLEAFRGPDGGCGSACACACACLCWYWRCLADACSLDEAQLGDRNFDLALAGFSLQIQSAPGGNASPGATPRRPWKVHCTRFGAGHPDLGGTASLHHSMA